MKTKVLIFYIDGEGQLQSATFISEIDWTDDHVQANPIEVLNDEFDRNGLDIDRDNLNGVVVLPEDTQVLATFSTNLI